MIPAVLAAWMALVSQPAHLAAAREKGGAQAARAKAAGRAIPTPASIIGWEPGEDRKPVDTKQIEQYFRALAAAAPERIKVTEIGKSWEGRPLLLAIISSEANMRNLARYKEISHGLALAKGLTDADADKLVREGKVVILIDHGKDGNEPATGEAAILTGYRLVAGEDEETRRIRDNAIVLLSPAINPDGREYMLKWYRKILGTEWEMTAREPWYDHPMIGHEGNRDNVILVSPEMQALAKVNWHEWNPQIVLDHHQGVPFPARIWVPPYMEPLNPDIHPLTHRGINTIGSAMAMRFEVEGKPGVISRATYTTWWNGSVDGSSTYHNQVGILVETQQRPARWASPGFLPPEQLPKSFNIPTAGPGMVPDAPSVFYPNPWRGGWWRFRDQVDYMVTASFGMLDAGVRYKDQWLRNVYQIAKENIEKGRKGNPFAYIFAPDQWDRGEAVELVNALVREGVEVHKTSAPFTSDGKTYPAGTYVAYSGQAFRGVLMDLLEPQHHPDLRPVPGGDPIPPYDQTAWTLPIGMGVRIDRVNQPFEATAQLLAAQEPIKGTVTGQGPVYLLSTKENNSYKALAELWRSGTAVSRATDAFNAAGASWPVGTFVVRGDTAALSRIADGTGAAFVGAGDLAIKATRLNRPVVGVYQSWVVVDHNPDEGWARWVLERYGWEYKTLHDTDLRTGDLSQFTAIILPDQEPGDILRGHERGTMPPEYVGGMGAEGAANLKRFAEKGGTVVAISLAAMFAVEQFGLPVRNAAERVPSTKLYVPGSYIKAKVDSTHPLAYGMPTDAAVMYFRRRAPDQLVLSIIKSPNAAEQKSVSVAATFGEKDLLLSGWQVGADQYLANTPAALQVSLGAGSVVLYNFRPQYRDQARGTFKFFFNALLLSGSGKPVSTTTVE
jgi:hypothetical protein